MSKKAIIVIGGGGHAAVLVSSLERLGRNIIGLTDIRKSKGRKVLGIEILGTDEEVHSYDRQQVVLVNGIGAVVNSSTRQECAKRMRSAGFQFDKVIDPTAVIALEVNIKGGVQVLAGAIIQPRVSLGQDTIVNTGARIDHDCISGDDCHICPGAVLAGEVTVGNGGFIGTGAIVAPGVVIGEQVVIGAGSVIVRDVAAGSRVIPQGIRNTINQA